MPFGKKPFFNIIATLWGYLEASDKNIAASK